MSGMPTAAELRDEALIANRDQVGLLLSTVMNSIRAGLERAAREGERSYTYTFSSVVTYEQACEVSGRVEKALTPLGYGIVSKFRARSGLEALARHQAFTNEKAVHTITISF